MMEAAVAYYMGTGKRKFLDVMLRFADLICDTFGAEDGKIHGYPGHQEVEIGLIKLYQVTGEQKYLEQAKYFIDARGVGENYFRKGNGPPGDSGTFSRSSRIMSLCIPSPICRSVNRRQQRPRGAGHVHVQRHG